MSFQRSHRAWLERLWRVMPASVVDAVALIPPLRYAAARWHEACGRIRRAARCARRGGFPARASAYRERLLELEQLLDAGAFPPDDKGRPVVRKPFGDTVLMALYSAAPWVENGYDIRTRCLRTALLQHGVKTVAVTRPNFPHDLDETERRTPAASDCRASQVRLLDASVSLWGSPLCAYVDAFAEQLVVMARESGASAIHAMSNHVVGLAAAQAGRRLGVPVIYEVRGLWHRTTVSREPGWNGSDRFALHEALERDAARRADRVVVLSRALARHVRSWGVDADRIRVIPNGVDETRFRPCPPDSAEREALGARPGSVLIGYVGTLTPYEGQDRVVRAAAALRAHGCDARLAFVGSGEEERSLRALAYDYRVPAVFHGRVPHDAVPGYLASFDICALPRRDDPACRLVPPVKLAEAMACGVPVVVSALAPLTEIVTHEKTGLVVPSLDDEAPLALALARLIREPGLRACLVDAARDHVAKRLRWADLARAYLPLFGASGMLEAG